MEGNNYLVMVKEDFSRYARKYFVSHKLDAADLMGKFLADRRIQCRKLSIQSCGRPIGRWREIQRRKIRKALSRKKPE